MTSGFKMVLCLVAMPEPQPASQVDHGIHSLVWQGAWKIKTQIERLGFTNLPYISANFVYDSHNNGWPKYIHTFQTFCLTASQLIHMFGTLFTFNGCYCLMRAIYSNFIRDLGMFVKAFLWYSRLLTAFAQATAIFFRNPLKLKFELRSRWR